MSDNTATKQDLKELRDEMSQQFTALTELIRAGFETANQRFDRLETRLDDLENQMKDLVIRVGALEVGQRDLNVRFDRLDGRISALHADITELYRLNTETRRKFAARLKRHPEQEKRLKRLEHFAASAARRLGIRLPD